MKKDWYKHALYKVHLDMHCPEWHESILRILTLKRLFHGVAQSGAKALYFFARIAMETPITIPKSGTGIAVWGNRDFLAEILAEAAKKNLPIMAYSTVIWIISLPTLIPNGACATPRGRALTDTITMDVGKWKYVCHNTGYAIFLSR